MSQNSTWGKTLRYSKNGFDKAWHTLDKLGKPVNRLSNKIGSEAFWPATLDKESEKAARILRSFSKDGFYNEQEADGDGVEDGVRPPSGDLDRPRGKQVILKKIPARVIQRAKGLAIFTTMRTGLWFSGSGGSGVLLARIPETGEWSPPSGIMLHTAGVGFLAGVDIYDCVVVINTYEALEAFKKVRCTLGGEVSAAAGPVGLGGVLDSEIHKRQAPIWTYMKSRGLYAGVQIDGTIIIERTDENERFYGERISVTDILAGKARHPPSSIKTLMETIKVAQGDTDVDESLLPPPGETPGDADLQANTKPFGIPAADDPDPFGVKALEAEGLFIREAGTKKRPTQDVFDFRPNPQSPVYSTFSRQSRDSSPRNSWRASVQSYASVAVQTDDRPPTAATSVSRASSVNQKDTSSHVDSTSWDSPDERLESVPSLEQDHDQQDRNHEADEDDDDDFEDEPIADEADHLADSDVVEVHEVSSAVITRHHDGYENSSIQVRGGEEQAILASPKRLSPSFTRARLVTIPKRSPPPALPPRHPRHNRDSASRPGSPSSTASASMTDSRNSPISSVDVDGLTNGVVHDVSVADDDDDAAVSRHSNSIDAIANAPIDKVEFPVHHSQDAVVDNDVEFHSVVSASDYGHEEHQHEQEGEEEKEKKVPPIEEAVKPTTAGHETETTTTI